jgi:hypothetical protein
MQPRVEVEPAVHGRETFAGAVELRPALEREQAHRVE